MYRITSGLPQRHTKMPSAPFRGTAPTAKALSPELGVVVLIPVLKRRASVELGHSTSSSW